MAEKKAYIILEIGWEYNDEYYYSSNNGETFSKPNEVFLDKEKAKIEWLKREIKDYRNSNLAYYIGEDGIKRLLNLGVTKEQFFSYIKETFGLEINDEEDLYDFQIPEKATDEQIEGLMKIFKLRFNKLHEINITE